MTATLDDIHLLLSQIKDNVRDLIALQRISPDQIAISEGLSDISRQLGLIKAGEFRSGNGQDPGKGFSGVRIGYPPFIYNAEEWNIAGVEDDVLQVGIRSSDGKMIAGGGDVTIDEFGVTFENQEGNVTFEDTSGNKDNITIYSDAFNDLVLKNKVGNIRFDIDTTAAEVIGMTFGEDTVQAERMLLSVDGGDQGARAVLVGGAIPEALIDLRVAGASGGSTFLRMRETTETPPNPSSSTDAYHLYMKDNKLIIQSRDSGGFHYKYLTLDDTSVTWVHTTTPP